MRLIVHVVAREPQDFAALVLRGGGNEEPLSGRHRVDVEARLNRRTPGTHDVRAVEPWTEGFDRIAVRGRNRIGIVRRRCADRRTGGRRGARPSDRRASIAR